jgi:beta-lactam-binding protein with PASTA domain/tRNA A-37 threonylcarbamoyl transferase component Bud32
VSVDTSTADPLVGTVLDSRYRLDARIARGGMATVYSGFDERLDRPVAVKVMHASLADDDAFVERFRREAKAAARLSHPSVVAIYDQGEDAGRVYLVMEQVARQTLRTLLREHGRIPVAQALDITAGVLTALAAAHAAGLVHRDVKPENVLVLPDGSVKVADFGLARAIEATNHTLADGTLLGTVAYLAPEQVQSGAADPRTDLYALGIVLFEMLTGTVPFDGGTPLAVAYRHVNEDVPDPSTVAADVPRVADNVVRAATRRDPDERYADAETMLSAVRRARSALGNADTGLIRLDEAPTLITALPRTAPLPPVKAEKRVKTKEKRTRRSRRPLLVFTAIAAVVLLVAGLAGWYLATGRYARAPRVVGLSPAAAATAVKDAGLALRTGSAEYSDTVPKGEITRQDPGAGARVKRGTTVVIHVSRGIRTVVMPDVAGKTEAQARALLKARDISVTTVTRRYDAAVPKDHVVSSSVPKGTAVRHGSAVSLVVSDGPAPVAVPDVRGKPLADATGAVKAAGLTAKVVREFSDTVPKDAVIDQSPTAGKSVARGTVVTLRVSKGPQTVTVPDVRGEKISRAISELEALGLKATVQHVRGGHGDVVLDQDPAPGAKVRVGTTVTLLAF